MANKFKSCSLETHKCLSCFKHGWNRSECSLNVFEDEVGYQEDPPK